MMGALPTNFSDRGWACDGNPPPPGPCGGPPPRLPKLSLSLSSPPLHRLHMGLSADRGSPISGAIIAQHKAQHIGDVILTFRGGIQSVCTSV